jgi:hypothetical protein
MPEYRTRPVPISTQFLIFAMNGDPINETAALRDRTLTEFEEYATGVITTAVNLGLTGGLIVHWYAAEGDEVLAHAGVGRDGAVQLVALLEPAFR